MSAELFALITAFLRGFSTIPTRKGLQQSTPRSSALIYLLVNTALLWSMTVILYPLDQLTTRGVEYFILAGLFAPGIARVFRDMSILRLGVTLTSPIVATNTLFAVIFATLLLQEPVTLSLIVGVILVVGGVNLISYRRGIQAWRGRDLLYPLVAALLFAASTNIRKVGLELSDLPILGAAITSSISLLILSITVLVSSRPRGPVLAVNSMAVKYFVIASLMSSIAFVFYFVSLSQGLLVRVQPIAATNPLFALLFSHLFLKDMERVTPRIVIGSALIFLGILFVLL
jgi:DME family drug/metabolite transporter